MPIRPENKHRYPQEWKQIRLRILARAGNCCEFCGAPNYQPNPATGSRVVLTIAHLQPPVENCEESNLAALCQLCHNRHDARERAAGIRARRVQASGQLTMEEA